MSALSRFDLNLLVVFEAIYAERGISRAATRLNLTQSAVSHALARLRDQVGDQLFMRRGHDMTPTATADFLIVSVRTALSDIEGALKGIDRFDPATSTRHFRIGVRGFTESVTIPALFRAIRGRGPSLTVSTVHHGRASLGKLFQSGGIDLAIDTLPEPPDDVASEKLGEGQLVVMVRTGHPVLETALDLDAYLSMDHVVASTNKGGVSLEDITLQGWGRTRRVVLRCQNYTTAANVVAESDAALTIPEHFARVLAVPGRHVVSLETFKGVQMPVFAYWNARSTTDPAISWLRALTREHLKDPLSDADLTGT